MNDHTLDCRGIPCPQPVLRCKEFVETNPDSSFVVHVDNAAARENVQRFLNNQGCSVDIQESGDTWLLSVAPGEAHQRESNEDFDSAAYECAILAGNDGPQKILVYIPTNTMGSGDDTLGEKLMENLIGVLPEYGDELWRIILVNGGVKLAALNPETIDKLKHLENDGVSILVCGTCLDFFGLLDKKQVGETTNMLDIVTSFQAASKIIRI